MSETTLATKLDGGTTKVVRAPHDRVRHVSPVAPGTCNGLTGYGSGGGTYDFGGTVTLDGSIVSDNIPDNCVNVPGC